MPMMSNSEMKRRWDSVRAVMRQKEIDWLICGPGHPNGYAKWLSDRIVRSQILVAFPTEGDMYFASHGDMVHRTPVDSYGVKHVVSCAQQNLLFNTQVPELLHIIKPTHPKKIGFLGMSFISAAVYQGFLKGMPDVEFVDATELIAPIKAVKSEEEIAIMRHSAKMHDTAINILREAVRPGRTANEIVEEVRHAMCLEGSEHQGLSARSAPPGSVCKYFHGSGDIRIKNGDQFVMLIECSAESGYFSEMMPTVCIGKIPEELKKVFDDVLEAQRILIDMAKPGADPMEMLRANDEFMKKRGYPPEMRLAGHGQGVDLVERPALSPLGETIKLESNMIISLHPTTHGEKAWGYPVNQSFLITDDGPIAMTKTPQEIIVV